ncbi:hypothetical protein VFPPC_15792 [Pochonia chlamydosporia 170]|uniref:Uncharacterized protein n=1 Tax=Pochonia chlamydosporia 170 TaxID=1380566 RepID=A0A179FRB8_METCM|nr:hypothetical protein VFPPC_15792 [Pochonia chlamydosporia 170]OAQ68154.2 hypothetical protein VFPPC_15792 [Pochonia chlamydosporia 170]
MWCGSNVWWDDGWMADSSGPVQSNRIQPAKYSRTRQRSGQIKSGQVWSGRILSGQSVWWSIWCGPVWSVWSSQVESCESPALQFTAQYQHHSTRRLSWKRRRHCVCGDSRLGGSCTK